VTEAVASVSNAVLQQKVAAAHVQPSEVERRLQCEIVEARSAERDVQRLQMVRDVLQRELRIGAERRVEMLRMLQGLEYADVR
jgi:hypothetical protein